MDCKLPFKDLQKVYCINVIENVIRKKFMENQFKKLNINPNIIEFIDAITPESEEYKKEINNLKYKNKIAQAISLSHKKIWDDIIKNKYYAALVLEDDIEFNIDYLNNCKNINIFCSEFKEKKYFIHLLSSYPEKIINKNKNINNSIANVNIKYGVGAYILSYNSALFLCHEKWFYPITQPIDDYMWSIKRKMAFKDQYAFLPFICQNTSQPKTRCFKQRVVFSSNFKVI